MEMTGVEPATSGLDLDAFAKAARKRAAALPIELHPRSSVMVCASSARSPSQRARSERPIARLRRETALRRGENEQLRPGTARMRGENAQLRRRTAQFLRGTAQLRGENAQLGAPTALRAAVIGPFFPAITRLRASNGQVASQTRRPSRLKRGFRPRGRAMQSAPSKSRNKG